MQPEQSSRSAPSKSASFDLVSLYNTLYSESQKDTIDPKMETNLIFIFTLLFLQKFGLSNNMLMTSSNVTCIERERQSLLAIKHSVTDRHNLLSTWSGVECCEWRGVGCDSRSGHVVKLDLRSSLDSRLEGELSPSLQNLKHLYYLDLSKNVFSGNIPEFIGSFEHLEYLNLSHSFYGGGVVPHHLGNLSRLQYLDLRSDVFPLLDDLGWVSSLSSLRYLDLSGLTIGENIDWFHPVSMLPSLLTLNLAECGITNIPSVKFINFTSLQSLDLSENGLNSTMPVWLSNLTGLMHLNLQYNNFHGKIPDFIGMFSDLATIDLSDNSFETLMPNQLCNLSSLTYLDLSENWFSGPIFQSVGQLSNLTYLDLSGNKFSGPIPQSIGLLSRLEDLNLYRNQLSGNIPMSVGQLAKLKNLDLSYNSLAGVLSESHFTKLRNLNNLVLTGNSLVLNFSTRWVPPFQLQEFDASSCNIGPHFPNWLQTQKHIQRLRLSNSSIRDTIPEWFENVMSHILELDLSHNQISGKLPRIHFNNSDDSLDSWSGILRMNSNKFEGSIATFPSNVLILDLSDNLLSGHVPQTDGIMNPRLYVVNLSKNRFNRSIPVHLCKVPSIRTLDLSHNKFSGRLPVCFGNLTNLNVIDLSNNTLTGVVPSSLGSLTNLVSLYLHNNRFEGNLPVSLQNLTSLDTLDTGNNFLTGRIPFWIGESLSDLTILNLQSNKFTGKIPPQLCQLNALYHLNLAHNNLSGTIPRCFSNLSGMTINSATPRGRITYSALSWTTGEYVESILAYIKGIQLTYTTTLSFLITLDLSSNKITGEIPDVLMNLVELKNLNLSRNQLNGQIPNTIGNPSQIESLDLSMNMLSGPIPQSLTSLNSLSYLNLSFNSLSGAIPDGNQLWTLTDPFIYEGNIGLCGPQVSRSCEGNSSSHNHVGEDKGQDDHDEVWWFYSGIGSGFVTGFMGLVGSLYFVRAWRLSYFMILENVYGWLDLLILLNLARLRRKFSPMIW